VLRYNAPNMLVQILFDAAMRRPGVDFAKRGVLTFSDTLKKEEGTD
jgi:hypothetical protein